MTIPELAIVLLSFSVFALIAVRLGMGVSAGKNSWDKAARHSYAGWETGASKTIGSREIQEDEYGIQETREGIMAVLADGMGKRFGGKIASRKAVEAFSEIFEDETAFQHPQYSLRKAFQGANRAILKQLDEEQGCASVAAVILKDHHLYYASAGNVKVAVYRRHELVPVTSGHTISVLARQKYEEGKLTREEALSLLDHHRLYNFVGQDGFRDIEFFDTPIRLYGGEYVVLMSDGLYETAKWKDMEDCLEGDGSCQDKAFRLVELVNASEAEEKDNGSVVVMKYSGKN